MNVHADERPRSSTASSCTWPPATCSSPRSCARSAGLEPGLDFLEVTTAKELTRVLGALNDVPELHRRVRLRGRRKAEQFRASSVYERLLGDLERDLTAFGSPRADHPQPLP